MPLVAVVGGWFERRRTLAVGVDVSGIGLGTLAGAPIAAALVDRVGWRDAYLLLGGVGAASVAGRLALGGLAARAGTLRTYQGCFALMAVSFAVWMVSPGYAGLVVFALLLGVWGSCSRSVGRAGPRSTDLEDPGARPLAPDGLRSRRPGSTLGDVTTGGAAPRLRAHVAAQEPSPGWTTGPDQGFLAALLANLSDALVACDAEGRLTLFNPAARALHGLPAIPLPAEQWAQYYDLYLADGVTAMPSEQVPLLRALRGDPVRDVEMVVAPAGKPQRVLRASGQQILDTAGQVAGAVVVMHDVTGAVAADRERAERVREQEQLKAAEGSLRRLQDLNAAALAINRQHTVDAVLAAITEQAAEVIGAEQSVASLTRNEDWAQAINAVVMGEKYLPWASYDAVTDGGGIYALVCETNTPVRLTQDELEAHPRWRGFGRHSPDHPPMRGWLAAPLIRRDGRNLGLVQLSDKRGVDRNGRPLEFDGQDEAALVQLAQVASLALEKAVEFEREHEVAVELQRSLLPALPALPGLELFAAYVPGRDEADLAVAGDLYDAFPLDGEHVALALGDVMGHGLMSANLMGQIRSALRALALLEHDPVVVVTALDRHVATLSEDAMATLAYGVLHVPTGRLSLVLAGHPPPLLRTADGVTPLSGEPGLPLGALPGSGYSASHSLLPADATLLLFSDGLVERRAQPIDAGIGRLASALDGGPGPLHELSRHLLADMTAGQNDDDVALLLVRRAPAT